MKYMHEIIWILSWPVLIYCSLKIIEFAVKRVKFSDKEEEAE